MQFLTSIGIAVLVIIGVAVVIGLAAAFGSPVIAAPIIVIAIAAFLVWRGASRTQSRERPAGVPTTEEASADPVRDSANPDAQVAQPSSSTRTP